MINKEQIILIILLFTLVTCKNNQEKSVNFIKQDSIILQNVYKIRPDSVFLGNIVETGRKQGIIIDSSRNLLKNYEIQDFIFTGYYGIFNLDNPTIVIEERFDNGSDSIQYTYYQDNALKSKSFKRNFKKNGIFLEFYEDGSLKFEGFYQNDILIDNSISYYPDKRIKGIGNNFNGQYIEYDEFGKVTSKTIYKNREIIEEQLFFYQTDTVKRQKIEIIQNYKDDNLINNTHLKVALMYSQTRNSLNRVSWELYSLWNGRCVCFDNQLYVYLGFGTLIINEDNVEYCINCINYDSYKKIEYENFYVSNKNNLKTYYLEIGSLTISKLRNICGDTNKYNLIIENNGNQLQFKELFNVAFFEFDINKDDKKELYIINYQTCASDFDIYRITD